MTDEPEVAADGNCELCPATQIERDDGAKAPEHPFGNRVHRKALLSFSMIREFIPLLISK